MITISNYTALPFLYDNKPSERFGLFLINLGDKGIVSSSGGGKATTKKEYINRNFTAFDYGLIQNNSMSFEFIFGSLRLLDRQEIDVIQSWLINQIAPKKLQIVQNDLENVYFQCRLMNPEIISIDNVPFAFKATVECNQPFALEPYRTKIYTPTLSINNLIHYNNTSNNDYTRPIIEVTMGTATTSVKITNNSDGGRFIELASLSPNEIITLDSAKQMITSSLGLHRLNNFTTNKHWFRLVQGKNDIRINGILASFKITSQNVRKVGS